VKLDKQERVVLGDADEALIAMAGLLADDMLAIADHLVLALGRIGE